MPVLVYRCSTLLVVGDNSPAVEAVVDCNSKLNPTNTTLLKVTKQIKLEVAGSVITGKKKIKKIGQFPLEILSVCFPSDG